MAEISLKKLVAGGVGPTEIDVNFNTILQGQADATIPLNVNLSDGVGLVTPTSVNLTTNNLDIVIPAPVVPSGVLFKTIEPSQYTSYRTGDEGWRVQNGFFDYIPPTNPKAVAELDYTNANFFYVLKNPLIVNGVSSTIRFVDVNGIQAFSTTGNADDVVIDKLTGLMYNRNDLFLGNWNDSVDFGVNYSITVNSTVFDDWYLISRQEYISIFNNYAGTNGTLDNATGVRVLQSQLDANWTASTYANSTTLAFYFQYSQRLIATNSKVGVLGSMFVRNARNLITAP